MTGPIVFEAPASSELSHRARLALAIVAALVLLVAVGVVEVGVLAAASVFSSSQNHGGSGQ
jgi:membrane protein YdbS with pleckstrin-like domain